MPLHARLQQAGYRIKADIDVSTDGRVRKTALLSDPVARQFEDSKGMAGDFIVPGPIYELVECLSASGNGNGQAHSCVKARAHQGV